METVVLFVRVTVPKVGGDGAVGEGITEFEAEEEMLVPFPFVAVIVNV
jgi:hypothetical protein